MLRYFLICILCFSLNVFANDIQLKGEMTQGSLIRGVLPAASQIWLNGKEVKISDEGHFAFGFGRDAELTQELRWLDKQGVTHNKTLNLTQRTYVEQKIEGVASKYVSPPKEVLARIKKDNQQIGKARNNSDDRLDFIQDFIWPAEGPISGVYGSRRVFNGVPKRPHFGVDVAGPTGTPVHAPADGIVTLWVPDMYYSGGTMIIDHGFGVTSTFIHLSKGHTKAGTKVKQGDLVAEIGATGRVTGPHLDWRINWFNERLDPALLVPKR
ncbi:M23 family metallopeptidase [Paraglaciecola aquimarina]|uniref:M23 family metallopeptidase n=1 Tax=Paraglaciecola algarum TaxID=3050085 RepID=A0ABS9D922_9ALTE|nr:M23 family metallopeptidase [Paraglaciecola sp. G1-23]MCF2949371.1 M23 family metallopeptidase [Paraglaciecola sp. G1-23]